MRDLASHYGERYYAERVGDEPYHHGNPVWRAFFGGIADAIVAELEPRTVLDAGCGIGFLVQALRERGVDAFGFDISEYAISQVPEDVRGHCAVGSITDELERDYDVIVCIEVLEHLAPEHADVAVANLARHTDVVVFSSTPEDFREATHLNVRPPEYWVGLFARHGLYRDPDLDADFVAPHALVLRRSGQTAAKVARQYERERARLSAEARALREEVIRLTEELDRLRGKTPAPVANPRGARFVRVLRRLGGLRRRAIPPGSARHRVARRIVRALPGGKRLTWSLRPLSVDEQYGLWLEQHALDEQRVEELRREAAALPSRPLISVVMPVHETEPKLLAAAIESVRAQLYDRWELCIADDASSRAETREVLQRCEDSRVKVTRLEERGGIALASNAALALATGEFVALLDHDDELKPDALLEVARLLDERPELDYVYSDEDKRDAGGRLVDPFFKPDWSPDLELSINYVTHLSVYRRELLERLGGFRAGYDGSQDYDLALRVTEATDRIAHIPRVLYTWRMAPGSAAGSTDAKPYAYAAAKRALADAIERRGLDAEVLDGPALGAYRVRRRVPEGLRIEVVAGQSNGAGRALDADILVFLDETLEPVTQDTLEALAEHAQRPEVGAVGGRIRSLSGEPEHEGVVIGFGGSARETDCGGYFGLGEFVRDVSAVAGCLATRREVFAELGGFDERYRRSFADVDYCLRAREAGYSVVYTPYAVLRRRTRRPTLDAADERSFRERWLPAAAPDPFYNPNLSLRRPFELALGGGDPYTAVGSTRPRSASSRR